MNHKTAFFVHSNWKTDLDIPQRATQKWIDDCRCELDIMWPTTNRISFHTLIKTMDLVCIFDDKINGQENEKKKIESFLYLYYKFQIERNSFVCEFFFFRTKISCMTFNERASQERNCQNVCHNGNALIL